MADYAINIGTRIGVAATLETTLEPTKRLLISRASFASKNIQIDDRLCDGAFDALQEGDNIKHDEIVSKAIKDLAQNNDVVVLAQASMARTVESLPENLREKVLSSPRLGIYAALQALELI
jgi:hypothetical protein